MSKEKATRRGSSIRLTVISAVLLGLAVGKAQAEGFSIHLLGNEAVESRLREYGGTNVERGARLKKMFVDAGCGAHLSEQHVVSANAPNVICLLPGTSGRFIIVGAHFDRVAGSAGVADNWSGASLLPSLYESVKVEPRQHTYIFIGFTAEEEGLVGSHFYARKMPHAQSVATDAMINMDTLGLAPTEVWVHRSDKRLVKALYGVATHLDLPLSNVNFEYVGSTDSESFEARRIPRITIHSLTQKSEHDRILHSTRDKLSVINLRHYYDTYNLLAVYLVFLDGFLGETGIATTSSDLASKPAQ